MFAFKTIDCFKPGEILSLIRRSYEDLIVFFPDKKNLFYDKWEHEDHEAFSNPDTVGKHVLFTCLYEIPVGYFSWDGRQHPVGIIGQHCILPEYRGQGLGKKQLHRIIETFSMDGFKEIQVSTGDHVFFNPAIHLYKSLEFFIFNNMPGEIFNMIQFKKILYK